MLAPFSSARTAEGDKRPPFSHFWAARNPDFLPLCGVRLPSPPPIRAATPRIL